MGCKKQALAALIGSICMIGAFSVQAGPTAKMLADTCAGCHGPNGESAGPATPNLAGISATYFTDSMLYFQALPKGEDYAEGARPATVMNRIAKGYTEEQIEAMAVLFASMPVYKADVPHDAAKAKAGTPVYEDACSKCHDEGGSLPDDDAGILAGQWLPWLKYSMEDFRAGHREMPRKMRNELEKAQRRRDRGRAALFRQPE
jgi:cytochrome subunit of sulfide dehydrogenase